MDSLRYMLPSLLTATALKFLNRMLMRGFTTVRDAAGADAGHREAIENGLFPGPRLFIAGRALTQTGGHGDLRSQAELLEICSHVHLVGNMGRIADGIDDVRRAVRDEIRLGANQIKIMVSGGVGSPSDPIEFIEYSNEELETAVDEASRANTYVMAHAYTAPAIRRAVEAGIRTIEHGNMIDEETAALMAKRGAYLVPTLITYQMLVKGGDQLGYPETSLAKAKQVLNAGTKSLEIAKAAGVKMAYGTDLMGEQHPHQAGEFLVRAEVLSPAEIIRSATVIGAEVLRMEGKLGVIAPGAFADLLVVDGNPLENLRLFEDDGAHLSVIMKDGKFYKFDNSLGWFSTCASGGGDTGAFSCNEGTGISKFTGEALSHS